LFYILKITKLYISISPKIGNNIMQKDPRTHRIIGAAMEVHNEIGPGHLEAVYQECLEIEFELQNIPFVSKPNLSLYYKKRKLKKCSSKKMKPKSSIV
jgi:GxxExxY protein